MKGKFPTSILNEIRITKCIIRAINREKRNKIFIMHTFQISIYIFIEILHLSENIYFK